MHKIVKALEIASQERVGRLEPVVAEVPVESPARAAASTSAHAVAPEWDNTYRETRTIRVPAATLERNRILTGQGEDPATRAMKLLRTQVLRRLDALDARTIAVVSPSAAEGKTLTAINLAIAIGSAHGRAALLVDLDWRDPSVHRHFAVAPEHDIVACLDGRCRMSEVLVHPGIPRFCFAPCRAVVPDASERLGSAAMRDLHAELRSRYANRVVLFDLPPLLATDDALSFLPNADAVLLVVAEGRTRRDDVARALETIDPARLLGTVVNRSSTVLPEY